MAPNGTATAVSEFEALRPHLLAVAYRLTGSFADAEDAVQDSWLRWNGLALAERDGIVDLRAWLTTVVSRLCLDRLRSAVRRRETYIGQWLPEPVVTRFGATDPLADVGRQRGRAIRGHGGARPVGARSAGRVRPARRVRRAVRGDRRGARDDGCRGSSAGFTRSARCERRSRTGSRRRTR